MQVASGTEIIAFLYHEGEACAEKTHNIKSPEEGELQLTSISLARGKWLYLHTIPHSIAHRKKTIAQICKSGHRQWHMRIDYLRPHPPKCFTRLASYIVSLSSNMIQMT